MLLRLVSPVRRSGSSIPQLVKRLPADIRKRLIGKKLWVPVGEDLIPLTITPTMGTIRLSLRTRDPSEGKARQGEATAYLEKVFQAQRQEQPVEFTRQYAVALSRVIYEAWAQGEGRERITAMEHTPAGWQPVYDDADATGEEEAGAFLAVLARLDALTDAGTDALEPILGPLVDRTLLRLGYGSLAPRTRAVVLEEFRRALADAMASRARNASGDYSPDPKRGRFPDETHLLESAPKSPTSGGDAALKLTALVNAWWQEQRAVGRAESTYVNYRGAVRKLRAFLKHDRAASVTPDDIVRFKDHRLASGVSARTVKDGDLAALKTVFGWAVANRKLSANPAAGITLRVAKKQQVRSRGYTEDEALKLLRAAAAVGHELPETRRGGKGESSKTLAAKRWVPLLMAFTGARVGEMAQLRKQDVVREADHWVLVVSPEAGTVKGKRYRRIPIHPCIVESGFLEFVARSGPGHLFLRPNRKTGDVLGPLQGVKNRVAEFSRSHVGDPNILPNHAWRHRFITLCRKHGVSDELRRMITGHTGEGVDETDYGEPAGLYREICKLPSIATDHTADERVLA